jgi:RNA polymerase sigma factor (TIGR02999 family)
LSDEDNHEVASRDITDLLHEWADGDTSARDELMTVVYADLKRRAAVHLRAEARDHILNPTALVHEAYLRLIDQRRAGWQNRSHFFAIASQMMRRILVDRARSRGTAKRSGRWTSTRRSRGSRRSIHASVSSPS